MWAKVAEGLQVPWRAVEKMHWELGEAGMARRARVVPFSLMSGATGSTAGPEVSRHAAHPQYQDHVTNYPTPSTWAANAQSEIGAVQSGQQLIDILQPWSPPPSSTLTQAPNFMPRMIPEQEYGYSATGQSAHPPCQALPYSKR